MGAVEGAPVGDLHGDQPPLPWVRMLGVALARVRGLVGRGHPGQIEAVLGGVGHGSHP